MVVKGGREIRGRVLEETPTHVSFYTDYGKKIQVHKSRVSVILRKGEVLAVNPTVGSIMGLKAESESPKEQLSSNHAPSFKLQNSKSEPPQVNPKKEIEPVTQNPFESDPSKRGVASSNLNESIPGNSLGFRFGPLLGITQSKMASETPSTNRTGAEAGVVAEFPFLAGLFLQPELLLSQAGANFEGTVTKYNYVKVPVLLKYRHLLQDKFSLNGFAGPYLGFRTEAKTEAGGVTTDIKSTTKSTLIGFDLGAGGEYAFSSQMDLFLNINYSLQLNNLDTTIGATSASRLRQLSFLTGVLFNL
jgi:hypothetical protein